MKKIFKSICLWAFAMWQRAEKVKMPVGVPYNRDPENPCEHYRPFKKNSWDE